MKKANKKINLFITLTLLILAMVCVCNVTFAYFSSNSQAGSGVVVSGLDINFVYKETSSGDFKTASSSSINLYSASGTISRGVPFKLSLEKGGAEIYSFGIQNTSDSINAYVRFWIDAYKLDSNNEPIKTINYGKYFVLAESSAYSNEDSSVENSTCYFGVGALAPDSSTSLSFGNTLTLKDVSEDDAFPADLLREKFQISISFEAVQAENKAYLSTFGEYGDEKGYYKSWR